VVKVSEDGITDAQTCRSNIFTYLLPHLLTYLFHRAESFLGRYLVFS